MFCLIEAALIEAQKQGELYMATVQQLIDEVRAQRTKVASLNTLMDGMRQKIQDLVANSGQVPADLQSKIDEAFNEVQQESQAIDAAIAENTPAVPTNDTGGGGVAPHLDPV